MGWAGMEVTRAVGWWAVPSPGYSEHEASLSSPPPPRAPQCSRHSGTAPQSGACCPSPSSSTSHQSLEMHLVMKTCFLPLLMWVWWPSRDSKSGPGACWRPWSGAGTPSPTSTPWRSSRWAGPAVSPEGVPACLLHPVPSGGPPSPCPMGFCSHQAQVGFLLQGPLLLFPWGPFRERRQDQSWGSRAGRLPAGATAAPGLVCKGAGLSGQAPFRIQMACVCQARCLCPGWNWGRQRSSQGEAGLVGGCVSRRDRCAHQAEGSLTHQPESRCPRGRDSLTKFSLCKAGPDTSSGRPGAQQRPKKGEPGGGGGPARPGAGSQAAARTGAPPAGAQAEPPRLPRQPRVAPGMVARARAPFQSSASDGHTFCCVLPVTPLSRAPRSAWGQALALRSVPAGRGGESARVVLSDTALSAQGLRLVLSRR